MSDNELSSEDLIVSWRTTASGHDGEDGSDTEIPHTDLVESGSILPDEIVPLGIVGTAAILPEPDLQVSGLHPVDLLELSFVTSPTDPDGRPFIETDTPPAQRSLNSRK